MWKNNVPKICVLHFQIHFPESDFFEEYKKDIVVIVKANNEMNLLIKNLQKDFEDLDKRFTKKNRDIGKIAEKKPEAFEKILNNAGKNANRCMEIASGSPLTDEEKNATRQSQINPECPSIANPNLRRKVRFTSKPMPPVN